MKVDLLLNSRQIDSTVLAYPPDVIWIRDAMLVHDLASLLNDPFHSGSPDEHMMTLLSQHETTGSRQGVETGLGKRLQLHLAVTVRECREHEERDPVGRLFVERPENPWLVLISGTPLQQCFRFLATVSTKIPLK